MYSTLFHSPIIQNNEWQLFTNCICCSQKRHINVIMLRKTTGHSTPMTWAHFEMFAFSGGCVLTTLLLPLLKRFRTISFLYLLLKFVFTLKMRTTFRSLERNSFRQPQMNRSLENTWMI